MPNVPKPNTSVSSFIAILVMLQVGAFIYGVGSGHLVFTDTQFGLISGYVLGAGTTILAFLYGSSKRDERAQELAAPVDPGAHPAAPDGQRLDDMLKRLAAMPAGPERDKLAADIAALKAKIAG